MSKAREKQMKQKQEQRHRIRVQFDLDVPQTAAQIPGKSMTQPDLNLTVRQLLQGYSRGATEEQLNASMKDGLYFETSIPVFNDLTDVEAYKKHLQDQREHVEEWLKNHENDSEPTETTLPDAKFTADPNTTAPAQTPAE